MISQFSWIHEFFFSIAAEKKKIKKIEEDEDTDSDGNFGGKQKVTGSELVSVRNSVVVEHLVQDIQDKSSMQEFRISGFPPSHGMHCTVWKNAKFTLTLKIFREIVLLVNSLVTTSTRYFHEMAKKLL